MSESVSLAMIVRDAEPTLARCLESVASEVDELVIVDTGSNDATRDIARRFTDKVYEFAWCEDFAAARQFAFDRATSRWVMWLDADDRVTGANHIRGTLATCSANVGAVHWKYIAGRDSHGNTLSEFWRERCVRNDGTYRWVGKVHEALIPRSRRASIYSPATVVVHERDVHAPRDRFRNLRILRNEYARSRAGAEPRLLLHMALELADTGDEQGAVWFLDRFLGVSQWPEQNYFAALKLAGLLRNRCEYPGALFVARSAHSMFPHWPNSCFTMAHIYYCMQDWERVITWSERGQPLAPPNTVCIVDPLDWRFRWIGRYTSALLHVGRLAEAQVWTKRALGICPGDPEHTQKLAWLEQSTGRGTTNV